MFSSRMIPPAVSILLTGGGVWDPPESRVTGPLWGGAWDPPAFPPWVWA